MSPIAKALVRARYRHFNRLVVGRYEHPDRSVVYDFDMLMIRISMLLELEKVLSRVERLNGGDA